MGNPWDDAKAAGNLPPWEEAKGRPGGLQRAWDALAVPEQMSRNGLKMMTDAIPDAPITGNTLADVAMGAPKIGLESVADAAPGFISRGSLATMGILGGLKAAAPAIKTVGGALGKAAEGFSGLEYKAPGVLAEAANDPTLIFGKGRAAAGAAYEAIKDDLQVRPAMLEATSNKELLDLGKYGLEHGDLSPQEALMARRAVDASWETLPKSTANYLRPKFDAIAKTISADADAGFQRALKSDALRTIFATNKTGGTSIAKTIWGSLLGVAPAVAMSPVAQGITASGLGAAAKVVAPFANNAVASGAMAGAAATPDYNAALAALRARRGQ